MSTTPYNPATLIDAYKFDHRRQYVPGTTKVYSNFTARTSRIDGINEVVFFGLQAFIKHILEDEFNANFFGNPKEEVLAKYQRRLDSVLGPTEIGTKHIEELWDLGYLPLRFCALSEGTLVPLRVPMFTVENTHPNFAWLTNYIETILSCELWKPCTSATLAYRLRKRLDEWAEVTGGDKSFVNWQGHDFSFRGMAGLGSAVESGAGHLLSFAGTDTVPALDFIEYYYPPSNFNALIGGSVAATEHSVMSSGGKETELDTYSRLLDLYPKGIVSVVSDTWNLWNVLTNILVQLKDKILARDGKLVIRPDSGDPVDIICGLDISSQFTKNNPQFKHPSEKGVIECLWEVFGGTINDSGYKQLNPKIGAIYGDAITFERADEICRRLKAKGFASTNIVFGVGSFSYQFNTRDTFGFAMKSTWAEINGQGVNLSKDPITDNGVKKSATGRLAVYQLLDKTYVLVENATSLNEEESFLTCVWENGSFKKFLSFEDVANNLGVRTI